MSLKTCSEFSDQPQFRFYLLMIQTQRLHFLFCVSLQVQIAL